MMMCYTSRWVVEQLDSRSYGILSSNGFLAAHPGDVDDHLVNRADIQILRA